MSAESSAKPGFLDRSANGIRDLDKVPCARESLLGGIASGVGIGLIKGFAGGNVRSASNWAVGTFATISFAAWTICWRNRNIEHRKIVQLIESTQKKSIKQKEETPATTS